MHDVLFEVGVLLSREPNRVGSIFWGLSDDQHSWPWMHVRKQNDPLQ